MASHPPTYWERVNSERSIRKSAKAGFFQVNCVPSKIISKEQAGFLKSSQRELQALATLSKKNDPRKYIDGKAPFPETEGSLIAKQVAIGLRYMHQKGFLHRDLKPLVYLHITYHPHKSQKGPGWKVKLADFGIARNIAGPTLPIHPQHWQVWLPRYIAPGLFESSDAYLYGGCRHLGTNYLGAIVFCMCTGAP
ncbi:kinase-like domain-containing protein, partial [Neurospora crassa]